jgi:hypothetical protein
MNPETNTWKPLSQDVVAEVPETPAVFEVGSLVRTVLYIAAAQGNLRARLNQLIQEMQTLPRTTGGYYFRYDVAPKEDEALASRLARYRAQHGGLLPTANRQQPRETKRRLRVASLTAA